VRLDPKPPPLGDICGFPAVLQQISKILNHSSSSSINNKGPTGKTGETPL